MKPWQPFFAHKKLCAEEKVPHPVPHIIIYVSEKDEFDKTRFL